MNIFDVRENLDTIVLDHDQQIKDLAAHLLELRQSVAPMIEFKLVTPMIEFKQPTKICGPNPEETLNAAGVYRKKEWVGLTGPEVDEAYGSVSDKEWAIGGLSDARVFFCAIEAKLREKNGG